MENENNKEVYFGMMQEEIEKINSNTKNMAMLQREMDKCSKKSEEAFRRLCVYAANYFTDDTLAYIHKNSNDLLSIKEAFDLDDYVQRFSDSSKIKKEDIDFLMGLIKDIHYQQEQLNNRTKSPKNIFWQKLADILIKGGENCD